MYKIIKIKEGNIFRQVPKDIIWKAPQDIISNSKLTKVYKLL